jgi:hypothetical protein
MRIRHAERPNRDQAIALAPSRPLLPGLALPVRYFLGLGLMFLCLWLPAFATLFRR